MSLQHYSCVANPNLKIVFPDTVIQFENGSYFTDKPDAQAALDKYMETCMNSGITKVNMAEAERLSKLHQAAKRQNTHVKGAVGSTTGLERTTSEQEQLANTAAVTGSKQVDLNEGTVYQTGLVAPVNDTGTSLAAVQAQLGSTPEDSTDNTDTENAENSENPEDDTSDDTDTSDTNSSGSGGFQFNIPSNSQ